MSLNGTLFEDKMRRFKGECALTSVPFILTTVQVPKFSSKSHETDNSLDYKQIYRSELLLIFFS